MLEKTPTAAGMTAPPAFDWVNDPRAKAYEMGRDAAVEVLQRHFDAHQSPEAEAIAAALSYAYAEVRCLVAPNFPVPAAAPPAASANAVREHLRYALDRIATEYLVNHSSKFCLNVAKNGLRAAEVAALTAPVAKGDTNDK